MVLKNADCYYILTANPHSFRSGAFRRFKLIRSTHKADEISSVKKLAIQKQIFVRFLIILKFVLFYILLREEENPGSSKRKEHRRRSVPEKLTVFQNGDTCRK